MHHIDVTVLVSMWVSVMLLAAVMFYQVFIMKSLQSTEIDCQSELEHTKRALEMTTDNLDELLKINYQLVDSLHHCQYGN